MAKRFMKSTINWTELEKRVPPNEKVKFLAFKGKSEGYLRRMLSNPPELPKINWDEYKKLVPVVGLVEKFQAEYAAYKVPYPEDTVSTKVDQQWATLEPEIKTFVEEMNAQIMWAEKEIAKIKALPQFEDTTMEMAYDHFPECSIDPVKNPTFWPHTEDEQLGYVDPTQKV